MARSRLRGQPESGWQPMDHDLAIFHKVASQTQDGQLGAIVTFVIEDSPAARQGIEPGDVLLRLHVEGRRRPVPIVVGYDDSPMFGQAFPWEMLDEIPDEYYGQIPPPWPTAESSLNRTLTNIGIGTEFRLEYAREGEILSAEMNVQMGPAHYKAASEWKSESLGLTVRDITYEVRRYFQMDANSPGIIISNIEPGSKASIAGLKPYEVILSINESEIRSVESLQKIIESVNVIRLQVKRMGQGRVVKIDGLQNE